MPRIPSTDQQAPADVFCTDDLALATILCMQGFDTTRLVWKNQNSRSQQAEWEFDRDERLDKIVSDYNSGTHRVEPRQFMTHLKKVRRGLYAFLDGGS